MGLRLGEGCNKVKSDFVEFSPDLVVFNPEKYSPGVLPTTTPYRGMVW
jgi:hypothetical protein